MPVTTDIVATYKGPRRVMRRLLEMGTREDRALIILVAGCVVMFIGQWPKLAREAHLTDQALNPLLGATLMAWVFVAPLLFYALGLASHWAARALGGKGTAFGARLALFWALLAASPLVLLNGLVAGFVGPGAALQAVGIAWCVAFFWFWIAGLTEAEWGAP